MLGSTPISARPLGASRVLAVTLVGYTMPATPGAYLLTGTATGLLAGRTMPAAPGAYVLTGTATGLLAGRTIVATPGAYVLTGTDVTLTKTSSWVLVATPGSYLLTGTATTLLWNRAFPGAPGAYVITGSAIGLYHGWAVAVASGSYLLTGTAVALSRVMSMSASAGSYVLTGTVVAFTKTYAPLVAEPGSYVITGNPNVKMIVGLLVDYLFPEIIFRYKEEEPVRIPKLNKLAEAVRLAGSMAISGAGAGGGGGGSGLSDGDKGDVVVSGGGTALTVESAHPAGGYFDVTGGIRASGTQFQYGQTSGIPADCTVYYDCNNYYGFHTWRRFAGGAPITMGGLQVADSGMYWASAAHIFRNIDGTKNFALLGDAQSVIYSPQVSFGKNWSAIGGQNQYVDLVSTAAYAGINFTFWNPTTGANLGLPSGVLGYYGYGLYLDGNPDLHLRCGADIVMAMVIHEIDATHAQVTVAGKLAVDDDPYSVSWDGNLNVPTKNAIFDKIEAACTGSGGGGAITAIDGGDATSSGAPYMAIDGGTA